MKRKNVLLLVLSSLFSFSGGVYAQSTGDSSSGLATDDGRPVMETLFFRPDQRRILEAIRQGVVEEETVDVGEFVPIVVVEEIFPLEIEEEEEVVIREREQVLNYDALIRNRTKGKTTIRVNGELLSLDSNNAVLQNQGIVVDNDGTEDVTLLEGRDGFARSKFQVKVGQIINVNGQIHEQMPIIRKSK